VTSGPVRFCRYAYAPNALGYCGPGDHVALFEYGIHRVADDGLTELARGFEGAWPYLSLIAGANGIADPLDARVVDAYWVGNPLLGKVTPELGRTFMEERFRPRIGRRWSAISSAAFGAGGAHHNHHVFVVYPWVGMLRLERATEPLRVLDRCRIRWGRVEKVGSERALVRSRALLFDGDALALGPARVEEAVAAKEGLGFVRDLKPGDHVSMHWGWICERLTGKHLVALKRATASAIDVANRSLREQVGGSILG
jgi:hypothetical protein